MRQIVGSSYADSILGSAGTQVIRGGAGNDTIDGGGGFDSAQYAFDTNVTSGIAVNMMAGTVTGDVAVGIDSITEIEVIQATNFGDTYDASGFVSSVGFDQFQGMGGDDTITGSGNTEISFFNATGGVSVDLAAGTVSGDLSVGNDVILGGVTRVFGSNLGDTIVGAATSDRLSGSGGDDVLDGAGGGDTLIGGAGNDTIDGGGGADTATYQGNQANFVIVYNGNGTITITDTATGAEGIDTLTNVESAQFADGIVSLVAPPTNQPPTWVTLINPVTSTPENGGPVHVADVVVTDDGLGTNALSLSGADAGSFYLVGNALWFAGLADYENLESYAVVVEADDTSIVGTPDAVSTTFTLHITNVNEAPTSVVIDTATVNENASGSTPIGSLTASDPDAGDTLTYSIVGLSAVFDLAGDQLVVKSGAVLDFETSPTLGVTIRATDANGLNFDQLLTITIGDNDEAPTGISLSASTVLENATAGTVVGTLTATDPDAGSSFTFAIADASLEMFEVVGNQIVVAAGAVIDFEEVQSDIIEITVTDNSGLTYSEMFTITITDVLEGGPTDIQMVGGTVAENSAANTVVATLTAVDSDIIDNHTFQILSDTSGGYFAVSGNAIVVAASADLDYEADTSYQLTVRAQDSSNQYFDKILTIAVSNVFATFTVGAANEALSGTATIEEDLISGLGGNDTLTGFLGDDTLLGGIGNDSIAGGVGTDSLAGGSGNDTYVLGIDDEDDIVAEYLNEGTDTVQLTAAFAAGGFTLADNVENLTVQGTSGMALTGNVLANVITGASGNDTIDGGAGIDTMTGGDGNDIYIVDSASDRVTETVTGGSDEIRTGLTSYSLAAIANVENLTYTGSGSFTGTGNALANVITSGDGADSLSGGTGGDTMIGGAGADTYVVDNIGDVVDESGGDAAVDTVQSSITYTLGGGVENLVLLGAGGIAGTGNAGSNAITGNIGANLIDGAGGVDILTGGLGNDTYVVSELGDVVIENALEGTDLIRTDVAAYTLGTDIENLTFTGLTGGFSGTGNAANNSITGASGNDTLDGGEGNDTLVGGGGNDIYIVDSATDVVTEAAGAGFDEIRTALGSYSLAAFTNVENLTYTDSGSFTGTGNALANVITSGDGADTLSGGAGADIMVSGNGADIYIVDNSADSVTDTGVDGAIDLVRSTVREPLNNPSNMAH